MGARVPRRGCAEVFLSAWEWPNYPAPDPSGPPDSYVNLSNLNVISPTLTTFTASVADGAPFGIFQLDLSAFPGGLVSLDSSDSAPCAPQPALFSVPAGVRHDNPRPGLRRRPRDRQHARNPQHAHIPQHLGGGGQHSHHHQGIWLYLSDHSVMHRNPDQRNRRHRTDEDRTCATIRG